MKTRNTLMFSFLSVLTLGLFIADMCVGSSGYTMGEIWNAIVNKECVDPVTQAIILRIRLVKAIVAVLCGVALTISGLQMQTLFRNPLAGPYVLGVSSGASLGVALLILGAPVLGFSIGATQFSVAGAAWLGAAAVLVIMSGLAARVKDIMVVLILGIMLSSGISAFVQILQYLSREEALKAFVVWTMGSLSDVTLQQLWIIAVATAAGLVLAVATVKPLNLLLLGPDYAVSMGLNVRRSRLLLFASTTLLAGTVTAFCGPIGFIGLAMPHVARFSFATADHRILMPASALWGAAVMLVCDIAAKQLLLPVNAISALLGIPIVVWVVWKNRQATM